MFFTNYTVDWYLDYVDPSPFHGLENKLRTRFQGSDYSFQAVKVAATHRIASENVDYNTRKMVKNSEEMLHSMDGDCQDTSVLLCSMYKALGLDSLLVGMKNKNGENHLSTLVEVYSSDVDRVCDDLRMFYLNEFDEYHTIVSYDSFDGRNWLVSGSTMTDFVGDVAGLESSGYVDRKGGGDWSWVNLMDYCVVKG
jgi:hypothetical protein